MELWVKAILMVYMIGRLLGLCKLHYLQLLTINNCDYMIHSRQTYKKISEGCQQTRLSLSLLLKLTLAMNVFIFVMTAFLIKDVIYAIAVIIFLLGLIYEVYFVVRFSQTGFNLEKVTLQEVAWDRTIYLSYYVMYAWSAIALFLLVS